ncbi:MAG: tetratricopeptide repeat protein [Acidimicrobiales bacterium]|nr:tetratricopeptide repeat protein [Acidimicrobiales bacterium]
MNESYDSEPFATKIESPSAGYDLGLLVVHGIGNQRQGATLTEWSDSLTRWLQSWVAGEGARAAKVSIPEANLKPGGDTPANLTMHVDLAVNGEQPPEHKRWLVAEGWWAETFEPPTFGELWTWSFSAVPAILALHANSQFRAAVSRFRQSVGKERVGALARVFGLLLALMVLIALSPLILALGTLLLVIGSVAGALPVAFLKNTVARLQLILVGTVGDSLRLLSSPTQAGAIKAPVARGLRWLKAQGCERIVVLAHSQGAAVSYQVLADIGADHDNGLDKIDSFISVGSGLPKVWAMANLLTDRSTVGLRNAGLVTPVAAAVFAVATRYLDVQNQMIGLLVMAGIAAATVLGLVVAQQFLADRRDDSMWRLRLDAGDGTEALSLHILPLILGGVAAVVTSLIVPLGFATFVATVSAVVMVVGVMATALGRIPPIADDLSRGTRRWVDLYAAKDPVPAGPTQTITDGRPEAWPVSNLRSSMRDHTYYTSNLDECMTYIGVELLEVSGVEIQGRAERDATARYGFQRRWRVGWRALISNHMVLMTGLFAFNTWESSGSAVQSGWAILFDGDEALYDRISPVGRPWFVPDTISSTWAGVLAVALYAVAAMVLVTLGQRLWHMWDNHDSGKELATDSDPELKVEVTPHLRAIIVVLAIVTWIAAWPAGARKAVNALDFGSWTAGAIVLGVLGAIYVMGRWIPPLLEASGLRARFLRVDQSRLDSVAAFGRAQIQRGNIDGAIEAYRKALRVSRAMNDPSAEVHGGYAYALDLKAEMLRRQLADSQEPDRLGAEIDALVAETDRHFREARKVQRNHVRNLLHAANFTAVVQDEPIRAQALIRRALKLRPRDAGVLGCAARFYFARGDAFQAQMHLETLLRLQRTTSQASVVDPMVLVSRFAQLVCEGPDCAHANAREVKFLVDNGVRAPGIDLRLSCRNIGEGWSPDARRAIVELADEIVRPRRRSLAGDTTADSDSIDEIFAHIVGAATPTSSEAP